MPGSIFTCLNDIIHLLIIDLKKKKKKKKKKGSPGGHPYCEFSVTRCRFRSPVVVFGRPLSFSVARCRFRSPVVVFGHPLSFSVACCSFRLSFSVPRGDQAIVKFEPWFSIPKIL